MTRVLVLALGLLLSALAPAAAQRVADDPLTFFYLDQKPEKLTGVLDRYVDKPRDWIAYPTLVGFFAVVFRKFPDWTERLSPKTFDGKTAVTIVYAYKLSGLSPTGAPLLDRAFATQPDRRLQAEFAAVPSRIEDLEIGTPTDLDITWGAFFGSGNAFFVNKILSFLAARADVSHDFAIDMTKVTMAYWAGKPDEFADEMRAKYDEAQLRRLVDGSIAQWALASNAKQHPKVRQIVDAYIAGHPQSPTSMGFDALLKR